MRSCWLMKPINSVPTSYLKHEFMNSECGSLGQEKG